MTSEKDPNLESSKENLLTPEQQRQKEELQTRLDELRQVSKEIQSDAQSLKKEMKTDIDLANLENRIHFLDGHNEEKFAVEVKKIEEQLDIIKEARTSLTNLYSNLVALNPDLVAQMQAQLPDHDLEANQQRAVSYDAIAHIKPQQ